MEYTLRPYQSEAIDRVEQAAARGVRRQLGVASTGLGKTVIFVALAQRMGCRTLIVAHRDELIEQAAARVREWWPDADIGVVKGKRDETHARVVVASVQTLARANRLARLLEPTVLDVEPFGLVVVDECFPAGTMVGDRPIELLRPGDMVPSWDEHTGAPVTRRVLRVMKRESARLVTARFANGRSVTCTPNHPLMTSRGWVPAGLLTPGMDVLSFTHHADANRDDVYGMLRAAHDHGQVATGLVPAARPSLLFAELPGSMGQSRQQRADGDDESTVRLAADAGTQSDEASRLGGEDEGDAGGDRTQTARARWKRSATTQTAGSTRWAARLALRSHHSDGSTRQGRSAVALQDRHRRRGVTGGGGDRRAIPLGAGPPRVRPSQGRLADWHRVVGVEIHEQRSAGGPGGGCEVYNLEVEGTHTYLVGPGIIAHNCHHSAAKSYRDVLHGLRSGEPDGPLVLGVTATPDRGDGKGLDDLFDEVTFSYGIDWGITHDYLSDLRGLRIQLDADIGALRKRGGDYDVAEAGRMLEDADAPSLIARAWAEHAAGRRTLVFTPTVATAEATAAAFTAAGTSTAVVDGAMSIDARRAALAGFSSGWYDVLVNCMVLTEGYDEPRTDCIVVARPTQSRALYAQMIGRGTRKHPDKADCLVVDVVGATEQHDLVTAPSLFGIEREGAVWDAGETVMGALREQVERHEVEGRLLATEARLFDAVRSSGRMAWVAAHDPGQRRRYELSLGARHANNERTHERLVLVEREAGAWRAGHQRGKDKRILIDAVSLELAQGVAEDYVRKVGAEGLASADARWRKAPATPKQKQRLKKWGVALPAGATKGEASELIDQCIARFKTRGGATV